MVEELAPAEQDKVVDQCYQCKLCYVKCPYVPPHEWQLDFPRLMLRAEAVAVKEHGTLRGKLTTQMLGRTDLRASWPRHPPNSANATVGKPGGVIRRTMEKAAGVAAERCCPPTPGPAFPPVPQTPSVARTAQQATVTVFPTCLVEYSNPAVGQDLVKVYERNGVTCSLPGNIGCCGAPWLHSGDFDRFTKEAAHNVEIVAAAVRAGNDIVVPQPTCGYVLKRDYPDYLGSDDAKLVAGHTYDASEYLWRLHKGTDTELDTTFDGDVPETTAYHVPCHLQAQNIGLRSRDLLKLTGTQVKPVQKCSGIDGMWGFRADNYELSRKVIQPLVAGIEAADAEVVVGDCHLANGAITQETGRVPQHPLQQLARAYGIPPEPLES